MTLKFNNRKTVIDEIKFDSLGESRRYLELKKRLEAGSISDLRCHVAFAISMNGTKVCRYIADFVYRLPDGKEVVEDFKSKATMTSTYRLKRRLMLAAHGIAIKEVFVPGDP